MRLKDLLTAFALGALSLSASTASAQYYIHHAGQAKVAQVVATGHPYLIVRSASNGNCFFTKLGEAQIDANIVIHGTAGPDEVEVVGGPMQFCGYNLDFVRLGRPTITVRINGYDGNDLLSSTTVKQIVLDGGNGDDILMNLHSAGANTYWPYGPWRVFGGPGNDLFIADQDDSLSGGAGDDIFCVQSGSAHDIEGGDGFDQYCGSALYGVSSAYLSWNCPCF